MAMLPFATAKAIARKLHIRGQQGWTAWCRAGHRPSNIPASPSCYYRNDGWISWPDWLGYEGRTQHKDMMPFLEARAMARKLNLKSHKAWAAWCRAGHRPSNIPSAPCKTYKEDGFISWPDWLGYSGRTLHKNMLPFVEARAIVRKLEMGSRNEWNAWCSSGKRPANIPAAPRETYRHDGFISMPDWLGYEGRAVGKMLPFEAARDFARTLKLGSDAAWQAWCKTGQRPANIPSAPGRVYVAGPIILYYTPILYPL